MTYSLAYPSGPGALISRIELPEKAAGPSSLLYGLDLTDWLGTLGSTSVSAVQALADPTLTVSRVAFAATSVTFLLGGGTADVPMPELQLAIYLAEGSRLDVVLTQPIVDLGPPPLPARPVSFNGVIQTFNGTPLTMTAG